MTCPVSFFMSTYHDLGGRVELPLPTRRGPRRAINFGTQDNNHFLQAPYSKVLLPKGPEGLRGVTVARGPGSPLRARRKALLRPWMQLEASIPFWGGRLGLSVIKLDKTFCINALCGFYSPSRNKDNKPLLHQNNRGGSAAFPDHFKYQKTPQEMQFQ